MTDPTTAPAICPPERPLWFDRAAPVEELVDLVEDAVAVTVLVNRAGMVELVVGSTTP